MAGKAIGPFGREQIVSLPQLRQHALAGNREWGEDETAEDQHNHRQLDDERRQAAPGFILLLRLFGGRIHIYAL